MGKPRYKTKLGKVSGLWKNKSNKGYCSTVIDQDLVIRSGSRLMVLPNKFKVGERPADYHLLVVSPDVAAPSRSQSPEKYSCSVCGYLFNDDKTYPCESCGSYDC